MVTSLASLPAYAGFLVLVAIERGIELVVSRRNVRWAKARGGVEVAPGELRPMAALHAALLPASLLEAALLGRHPPSWLAAGAVTAVAAAQALRWWAVATLGRRWSVRVVVIPGAPAVTGGPYRLVRHPNYLAVIVEVAAIPLAGGCWITAMVASALNAAILARRVRIEERALAAAGDWARTVGARPRFVPRLASTEHP